MNKNRNNSSLPGLSGARPKNRGELLADELERELTEARQQGIFGIVRLWWEAWVDERLKKAHQRKLQVRKELVAAKTAVVRGEQELSETMHSGIKQDVCQAIETAQLDHLRSRSAEGYDERMTSRIVPQLVSSDLDPSLENGPPMERYISEDEINQEALKLVVKLASGSLAEADRQELEARYPPLVAQEILRRAMDLVDNSFSK